MKETTAASRRRFLSLAAAALAAACSPLYVDARRALQLVLRGFPDAPLTREQVERLPYATIRAKVGRAARSVLVLGRYEGQELHWIGADRSVLTTRHGRLVKTFGFAKDLKHTQLIDPDPVADGLHRLSGVAQARRVIDFENNFGISVHATLTVVGRELIEILYRPYHTVLVREANVADVLDWRFENHFWADQRTGFVWKSIQHFAPAMPPAEIETLKPAA